MFGLFTVLAVIYDTYASLREMDSSEVTMAEKQEIREHKNQIIKEV